MDIGFYYLGWKECRPKPLTTDEIILTVTQMWVSGDQSRVLKVCR